MTAFAPQVDGFGRLRLRPCLAMVGCSADHLIIDLVPQAGTWPIVQPVTAGRHHPVSPAAAAVMAACLALPAAAATHEVRAGETLSSISRTLFGSPAGWRRLYQANRHHLANPHRLVPGTILQIPDAGASPPPVTTSGHVIVRPGDTLFSLAKRHLGNGKRWPELWAGIRHRLASPAHLPVGLAIPLPETVAVTPPAAAATSPPSASPEPPPVMITVSPEPPPAVIVETPPAPGSDAPTIAVPVESRPAVADLPAVTPAALMPVPPAATIEPPFASHVGISFDPVTYHEGIVPQQVTARGTIFNSFGAEAAWRLNDWLQVSGQYLFNGYPLTRLQPTGDRRVEHHGRLTAFLVWPLQPQLELSGGLGGQWTGYGVAAGPPVERPDDLYDTGYQRWLAQAEARIGWRPWPDRPFTVTAGLQALPYGQGFRLGGSDAIRLWGFGWSAGARYTIGGFALEATYRGQRLFGEGYGQSADLLHTGIAYYFH
jgi:hypothetical protein